jgi:conjugal transfer pilus assembly protein TraD
VTSDARTGNLRRYLSVAMLAGLLLAPSLPWAVGVLAAALALGISGPLVRAAGVGWRARGRSDLASSGVVLGTDPAGRPVHLRDAQLAAHALIVGASGSGKTTTLLAILGDQIRRGNPVIAIDMKGSPGFAAQLRRAADAAGRELRVWTPDGPSHWNPLAHGNFTELKDKLILTERFSEPHYMRAAERYVQSVLQVLHAAHPGQAATLDEVVSMMEPRRLATVLRRVPRPLGDRVQDYLASLTTDQLSGVRGLGTRLALLSESSAGPHLAPGPASTTIDLHRALDGGEVVLFSLNSSVYGKLAAQLGALAIQDVTSASGHRLESLGRPLPLAIVAIDEFSALGADNLLALLARGREAGTGVLAATQEFADLERAGHGFRDQVVGISAVKIVHRQEVPASAQMIAQMAGTERFWEETRQLRGPFTGAGGSRGTRRQAERFVVHPNEIKTLRTGEAMLLTKSPVAKVTRLLVSPVHPGHAAPGPASARAAGRENRPPPVSGAGAGIEPEAGRAPARELPRSSAQRSPAPNAQRSPPPRGGRGGRGPEGPDQPAPGVIR